MRRMRFFLAATAVAALALPAVPALAGGGHGCLDGATAGQGDLVEIVDGCFTPSTLRVAPGDTVTFVNQDGYQHNVSANGWGQTDPLHEGDSFQVTFEDAGIYPFACLYHRAMVGAIVVGETGAGIGELAATSSQTRTSSDQEIRGVAVEPGETETTTGWMAGGVIGLAAGLGIGLLVRRRSAASRET